MYVYIYLYMFIHNHAKHFLQDSYSVFIACAFYYVSNYVFSISLIFNVLQLKYYKSRF